MKKLKLNNDEDATRLSIEGEGSDVENQKKVDLSTRRSNSRRVLTANLLNNEIVKMRKDVEKAKYFVANQLKRKLKFLEKKSKLTDKERLTVPKMKEEFESLKTLSNDDVAKFAILNKKKRDEVDLSISIPVAQRCLSLLATAKNLMKVVEEFRSKYNDWEVRSAYFLQRLGQQHKQDNEDKKLKKKEKQNKIASEAIVQDKEENEEEVEDEECESEEAVSDEENEDVEISDVEMGSGSEDEEVIANRRNLLLGLCGIQEDKKRPKVAPKPKKLIISDDEDVEETRESMRKNSTKTDTKTVAKDVVKRAIEAEAAKTQKERRTLAAELKKERQNMIKRPATKDIKTSELSQSIIKKVKLSEGGTISLKKSSIQLKDSDSEEDDTSDVDNGTSFFLDPLASDKASSDDDGINDDDNFKVIPLHKKGPKEMSKGRQRLQGKMEKRRMERKPSLQQKKKKDDKNKIAPDIKNPETLHPSWAARVQKKQQLTNVKPQGKRVVFNEDDD